MLFARFVAKTAFARAGSALHPFLQTHPNLSPVLPADVLGVWRSSWPPVPLQHSAAGGRRVPFLCDSSASCGAPEPWELLLYTHTLSSLH